MPESRIEIEESTSWREDWREATEDSSEAAIFLEDC